MNDILSNKIIDICIMKLKMSSLHYALLAGVVLLVVYCGVSFFREGLPGKSAAGVKKRLGIKKLGTNQINSRINSQPFYHTKANKELIFP